MSNEITVANTAPATTTPSAPAQSADAADMTPEQIAIKENGPLFSSETEEEIVEVEAKTTENADTKEEVKTESSQEGEVKEDVKVEEKKETVDPKFASRFASLSRKEKQLAEKEKSLKLEKAKLSKFIEAQELTEKGDLLGAAEKLGLSVDDFVNKLISKEKEDVVNENTDSKILQTQKELQDLKRQIEKERLDFKRQQAEAQIVSYKKDIENFINKDPVRYEICSSMDLGEQVFQTIKNHYEQYNEVLSIQEAADAVEAFYEEEFDTKFSKINKFKKRFTAPESKTASPEKKVEDKKPIRTLTNKDASTSSPKNIDDMTDEERETLALKVLRGQA